MRIEKQAFNIALANSGMLLGELCETANVTAAAVFRILSGNREARPQTVGKLARALGVPVESIIIREEA